MHLLLGMYQSGFQLPPPPLLELKQFAEHYAEFPDSFDISRILEAIDVLLGISQESCVSSSIAQVFFRKFELINRAAINIEINDVFKQVKLVFPELFGHLESVANLEPAVRGELTGPLINSLLAESFSGGRLANRAAQAMKDLLNANISHLVQHDFIDVFQDLFEEKCGAIDVTQSYKTCIGCLALCQFSTVQLPPSGDVRDFAVHQHLISEFFTAVNSEKLYLVNEPLFCGGRLVMMAKFVQFHTELKNASSGGVANSSQLFPSQEIGAVRQTLKSQPSVQDERSGVALEPYKPQTHTLETLRSLMELEKTRTQTWGETEVPLFEGLVSLKKDSGQCYARNPVLDSINTTNYQQ